MIQNWIRACLSVRLEFALQDRIHQMHGKYEHVEAACHEACKPEHH